MDKKLEDQRIECTRTKSNCENTLEKLEEKILEMLQQSQGNLVDDVELIETLQTSKETEEEVKNTIQVNKTTFKKIIQGSNNYKNFASISSTIYFLIQQFHNIEYVYHFSLEWFINIFKNVVEKNKESKVGISEGIVDKIDKIDQNLRYKVYKEASFCLFDKHKILLKLMMANTLAAIDEKKQKAKGDHKQNKKEQAEEERKSDYYQLEFKEEFNFFLKGAQIIDREN